MSANPILKRLDDLNAEIEGAAVEARALHHLLCQMLPAVEVGMTRAEAASAASALLNISRDLHSVSRQSQGAHDSVRAVIDNMRAAQPVLA